MRCLIARRARRLAGSLVALAALASAVSMGAPAGAAGQASLAQVRAATAPFHSLGAAQSAHYEKFLPCFDQVGVGGMGQHYVNFSLMDGAVDATHPEALVYDVSKGKSQLVAVEYLVPQSAWAEPAPPSLFGHSFHRNDALGIWALHAWIWRPNPLGMHEDFNPQVPLCA